jgi:hypothetical protein
VHNNGDRAGADTLGAFGVLEEEEAREGDGVWHLLMEEDIKDPGKLRCGMVCLIRCCHPSHPSALLNPRSHRRARQSEDSSQLILLLTFYGHPFSS